MKDILFYVLVFYAGVFSGFALRSWLVHRRTFNGTIYVRKNPEKTTYSLELDDFPEVLELKKKLVLKVKTSYKSLDRE